MDFLVGTSENLLLQLRALRSTLPCGNAPAGGCPCAALALATYPKVTHCLCPCYLGVPSCLFVAGPRVKSRFLGARRAVVSGQLQGSRAWPFKLRPRFAFCLLTLQGSGAQPRADGTECRERLSHGRGTEEGRLPWVLRGQPGFNQKPCSEPLNPFHLWVWGTSVLEEGRPAGQSSLIWVP